MLTGRLTVAVLASVLVLAGCASAGDTTSGVGHTSAVYSLGVSSSLPETGPSTVRPKPTPTRSDSVPPVPSVARRFAWSDAQDSTPEAFTLTVVRGISPRDALRIVAPHPRVPVGRNTDVRRRIDRANAALPPGNDTQVTQIVTATRVGAYTLVLEDNGFAATENRVVTRLSAHGPATVLYTSVNSDYSYLFARGGKVVRSFNPLLGDVDSGRRLPQERGLPFAQYRTIYWTNALSLELTRRLIGYVVRPRDFDFDRYQLAVGSAPQ